MAVSKKKPEHEETARLPRTKSVRLVGDGKLVAVAPRYGLRERTRQTREELSFVGYVPRRRREQSPRTRASQRKVSVDPKQEANLLDGVAADEEHEMALSRWMREMGGAWWENGDGNAGMNNDDGEFEAVDKVSEEDGEEFRWEDAARVWQS